MTERHPFIKWLRRKKACAPGIEWAKTQATPQDAWNNCEESAWMVWLVETAGAPTPEHEPFRCWCLSANGVRSKFPRIPWKAPKRKPAPKRKGAK